MKTVFKSDEIPHVWVNEGAPHGRCPGNARFDGDAYYSYQTVIARRIRSGKKVAYIVDHASFPISTSKTQRYLNHAFKSSDKLFNVHCGSYNQTLSFTPKTLRDFYLAEFKAVDSKPSRYAHKRADNLIHRMNRLESAIDVATYFGLPLKALKNLETKMAGEYSEACKVSDAYNAKLTERRNAMRAKAREAQEKRDAIEIAAAIERAEGLLAGKSYPELYHREDHFGYNDYLLNSRPDLMEAIQARRAARERDAINLWIQGDKSIYAKHEWPTLLRADGDEMETTKGARVPLDDARRSYLFAQKVRARGWHRNGESHKIGMYDMDSVNEVGVICGCHRLPWNEIERFAATQGWKAE